MFRHRLPSAECDAHRRSGHGCIPESGNRHRRQCVCTTLCKPILYCRRYRGNVVGLRITFLRIHRGVERIRDANFFPRRVHADAAAPVEPVGAGGESPGAPGAFVVERGDELQQSVTGGIDMGAEKSLPGGYFSAKRELNCWLVLTKVVHLLSHFSFLAPA